MSRAGHGRTKNGVPGGRFWRGCRRKAYLYLDKQLTAGTPPLLYTPGCVTPREHCSTLGDVGLFQGGTRTKSVVNVHSWKWQGLRVALNLAVWWFGGTEQWTPRSRGFSSVSEDKSNGYLKGLLSGLKECNTFERVLYAALFHECKGHYQWLFSQVQKMSAVWTRCKGSVNICRLIGTTPRA